MGGYQVLAEAELLAGSDGQLKKLLEEREDGTHYIDAQYVPLHHPRFLPKLVIAALTDGIREDDVVYSSEGVDADCIELHMQLAIFLFCSNDAQNIAKPQTSQNPNIAAGTLAPRLLRPRGVRAGSLQVGRSTAGPTRPRVQRSYSSGSRGGPSERRGRSAARLALSPRRGVGRR